MGLYELLRKTGIGTWISGMLALGTLLLYGLMTGGSVSTMRAVTMFLISVGARLLGRCYDLATALSASAILLLLDAPANLFNSGFLLSFGAVLGIGVIFPVFLEIIEIQGKGWKTLAGSLGVQLITLPIVLWTYGEVSLSGIVLNLFVLPTVGAVLVSGLFGCILGFLFLPAAEIALFPGRLLLWFYEWMCRMTGRVGTWIVGKPQLWQILLYGGCLGAALLVGKYGKNHRKLFLGLLLCVGLLILVWRPSGMFSITCLDVGQGDGIVLETPGRCHILVDGGSSNKSELCRYQLLPYLKSQGIRCLDAVFVSHTDEDHISGIRDLLKQMAERTTAVRIKELILPDLAEKPETYKEMELLAQKAGVAVRTGARGGCFELDGMKLQILSPVKNSPGENVNEEAMVFQVQYQEFSGLFTGDIGEETEKKLLPFLGKVDFLKVGHHGSRNSSSKEFLEKIKPELAVISCSDSNTYGHPAKETIERLEEIGARTEFTMKSGAVRVNVREEGMQVQRFLAG